MGKIKQIKETVTNNTKVIENYSFMTFLQVAISLFGILIYPYIIRTLKPESYGLYVFALSITSYFLGLVSFGFSFTALKLIAQNIDNKQLKTDVFSSVFTAKCYLALLSLIIFVILLFTIPILRDNKLLFSICFAQIAGEILFPVWYFQAIQKMRIVTYIQLCFRVLSLPFIFILIKTPNDVWIYALITSLTVIMGAITSHFYLLKKEEVSLHFVPWRSLKNYFRDATPFFWTAAASTLKEESIPIIIGSFFGMKDVALYDLANKIILLPRMLTMNINKAIFPKIIQDVKQAVVKRIIQYEFYIGLAIMAVIALAGYWLVLFLGGVPMLEAYPLAVILSITILAWLIVGCYNNFIFIPNEKFYFVAQNELIALVTFFIFTAIGLVFFHTIFVIVISLGLSSLCEILYCIYLIKKHNLLT